MEAQLVKGISLFATFSTFSWVFSTLPLKCLKGLLLTHRISFSSLDSIKHILLSFYVYLTSVSQHVAQEVDLLILLHVG